MEGREEGKKRKRKKQIDINCLPPACVLTGPGIETATEVRALDKESNPRLFGLWDGALTTEQPTRAQYMGFLFFCFVF